MEYDKKRNGEIHKCTVCEQDGASIQHHISGRRYSNRTIWVHYECHQKIHNPTAYNLEADWAYKNGYLIRHNTGYNITMKQVKKKSCSHSKSYYDGRLGYIKCNYCGQKVEEIRFGGTKTQKTSKPLESSKKSTKMGYEVQDPRVKQAAQLQNKITSLSVSIKKNKKDKEKVEILSKERDKLVLELRGIEQSYES